MNHLCSVVGQNLCGDHLELAILKPMRIIFFKKKIVLLTKMPAYNVKNQTWYLVRKATPPGQLAFRSNPRKVPTFKPNWIL